jgi:hypothetical protein
MVGSPLASARSDLCRANNCMPPRVEAYVEAGIAPRRGELDHFEAWGGTLPATDAQVANYLADHATLDPDAAPGADRPDKPVNR